MKYKCNADCVVVEEIPNGKEEYFPTSKLLTMHTMPDDPKQARQSKVGKVIAVGDGFLLPDGHYAPLTTKVGDIIRYNSTIMDEGDFFKQDGGNRTIIKAKSIFLYAIEKE